MDESADARAAHDALRQGVAGGVLWYVLLHSQPSGSSVGTARCSWVVLFAVGQSLRGDRLVGVVSHQMCHNLCD